MGRTGSLFTLEQEGICAAITAMAKGLGADYQLIGRNGHTYLSLAVTTAGAMAVMREIEEYDLPGAARTRGAQLEAGLRRRLGQHARVGDIRGWGLFWTAEMWIRWRTPLINGSA